MAKLRVCENCGSQLKINPKTNILTCPNCRTEYRDESEIPEIIEEIIELRQGREFVKAEEKCKEFIKKNPRVADGYWQLLLAEMGVVYVPDGKNGAKPTFFCFQYEKGQSIRKTENYIKAIEYASRENKERYQKDAEYLQDVLDEFFSLLDKEAKYDIFISFKQTEEVTTASGDVRRVETDDCKKAREIYNHLKDKYKVFFSPESIGRDTGIQGEKYEPRILKALQSSQAMILVGTKKEYLESEWVKNEWRRYQYFIEKGIRAKNSLIFAYMGTMPPLPTALKDIQLPNVDMFNAGYLKDLEHCLRFVQPSKGLASNIKGKEIETEFAVDESSFNTGYDGQRVVIKSGKGGEHIELSATEESDLQYAKDLLANKNFAGAIRIASNIVLNSPNNAQAYWLRFCAKIKAINDNAVPNCVANVKAEDFADFDSAINCASEKYALNLVDLLLRGIQVSKSVPLALLKGAAKYFDVKRSKKALEAIIDKLDLLIRGKKIKQAEALFATVRENLFMKENLQVNKWATNEYATILFEAKQYDTAKKYFEQLAASERNEEYYSYLLSCRLKTPDYKSKKFKIEYNPETDTSKAHPKDLDETGLIERILYFACENGNRKIQQRICDMVSYQIRYNTADCENFIYTAYNVFRNRKMDIFAKEFLKNNVADVLLELKNFKLAEKYYMEIIKLDQEAAFAHWGLLKCELKVTTDYALACSRRSLAESYNFENARKASQNNPRDRAHYMYVLFAQTDKSRREKLKYIDYCDDIDSITLQQLKDRQKREQEERKRIAKEHAREVWEKTLRWLNPLLWVLFGVGLAGFALTSVITITNGTPQSFMGVFITGAFFLLIVIIKGILKSIEEEKIWEAIFTPFGVLLLAGVIAFAAAAIMTLIELVDVVEMEVIFTIALDLGVLISGISRVSKAHENDTYAKNSASMWVPVIVIAVASATALIALSGSLILAMIINIVGLILIQIFFNDEGSDGAYDDDYNKTQLTITAIVSIAVIVLLALNIETILPGLAISGTRLNDLSIDLKVAALIAGLVLIIAMFIMQANGDKVGAATNNFASIIAPLAVVGAYLGFLTVAKNLIEFVLVDASYTSGDLIETIIGAVLCVLPGLLYALVHYWTAGKSEEFEAFIEGMADA